MSPALHARVVSFPRGVPSQQEPRNDLPTTDERTCATEGWSVGLHDLTERRVESATHWAASDVSDVIPTCVIKRLLEPLPVGILEGPHLALSHDLRCLHPREAGKHKVEQVLLPWMRSRTSCVRPSSLQTAHSSWPSRLFLLEHFNHFRWWTH